VLALGLAVAAIFFALKKIAGISLAVIFVLLLNFEPFYIALTRVVHLEGLLATFMLAAFLWFYLAFIHQSDVAPQNKKFYHNKSFLFASFFAACAVLTKTSALIILPTFGLMLYFNSKNIISSLKYYIPWLVLVSVFFILLWPAMWVQPVSVLNELSKGIFDTGVEEGHIQLYFGELVDDPGPTFYFVVLLLRSSLYMIPGFLLTLFSYKKLSNSKKKFIKYTLFFSAMYFIEMTIPTKKLDRYILPALVLQLMTSAVGLEYFFRELFVTKIKAVYKYLVAICFILPAFFTYLYLNGDYFSYYSPYFGGLRVGIKVLEPKWLIGQKQIKGFFSDPVVWADFEPFAKEESLDGLLYKSTINERLLVGFPEKYYTQVWPFIREVGAWATIKTLTPQAVKTAYFVYPVWDDTSADEDRFEIEYLGSISERGVKLYNVYRSCRIFDCGREN
ncbi:hypothetical protein KDA10_00800, partial [candidate division WWE3 bacterium]|nr:hypothetical protein [candidate division WWE3 bacterium]